MRAYITCFTLFFLLISSASYAQIPQTVSYQGYVSDGNGPLNGNYAITLSLYDTVTGGNQLWTDIYTVDVSDGQFSVRIGSGGTALPNNIFDQELWLGIEVESDGEMTPRSYLTSVPYAFVAAEAQSVSDGVITSSSLDASLNARLLPYVIDSSGNTLGQLLSIDKDESYSPPRNIYTFLTDKGYLVPVDQRLGSMGMEQTIYYAGSGCTGQAYIKDPIAIGHVYKDDRYWNASYLYRTPGDAELFIFSPQSKSGTSDVMPCESYSGNNWYWPAYLNDSSSTGFDKTSGHRTHSPGYNPVSSPLGIKMN